MELSLSIKTDLSLDQCMYALLFKHFSPFNNKKEQLNNNNNHMPVPPQRPIGKLAKMIIT